MLYLLDHAFVVAYLDGQAWAKSSFDKKWEECYLPSIVLSEIYQHIDSDKQEALERFVNLLPIVDFDKDAAVEYSSIQHELKEKGKAARTLDVLIAAIVRSRNATLVTLTRRLGYFGSIPNLRIEDWETEDKVGIRCVTRNQPGVIHIIARALADLQVNIISIAGESYGRSKCSYLKFTIELPPNVDLQDVESSIHSSNIEIFGQSGIESVELQEECSREHDSDPGIDHKIYVFECYDHWAENLYNQSIQISCHDRIALLADITYCLLEKRIDVVTISSLVSEVSEDQTFNIFLTLSSDAREDLEEALQQIREVEGVINANVLKT